MSYGNQPSRQRQIGNSPGCELLFAIISARQELIRRQVSS